MSPAVWLVLAAVAAALPWIWRRPAAGVAVCVALLQVRPQDIWFELEPFRLLIVVAAVTVGAVLAREGARPLAASWPELVPFAALLATAAASWVFSPVPGEALPALLALLKLVLLAWLCLHLVRAVGDLRLVIWAWLIPLAAHTAWSLWRDTPWRAGAAGLLDNYRGHLVAHGPAGAGDANYFARALIATLPLWWLLGSTANRAAGRAIAVVGGAMSAVGIVYTFSRSGFLVGTVVLSALAALALRRLRGWQRAVVALTVAAILWSAAPETTYARMGALQRPPDHERSVTGRIEIWERGLELARERPLLGVGLGRFESAFGARWSPPRSAHSMLVEVLAETGVLGLIVYLGVLAATFHGLERLRRAPPGGDGEPWLVRAALALEIALLGDLLISLTLPNAFQPGFVLLLALSWTLLRYARRDEASTRS